MSNAVGFPSLRPLAREPKLLCPDCALPMACFTCDGSVVEKCAGCQGIWFVLQLFIGLAQAASPLAGVAWWAHISGFLGGLAFAWLGARFGLGAID